MSRAAAVDREEQAAQMVRDAHTAKQPVDPKLIAKKTKLPPDQIAEIIDAVVAEGPARRTRPRRIGIDELRATAAAARAARAGETPHQAVMRLSGVGRHAAHHRLKLAREKGLLDAQPGELDRLVAKRDRLAAEIEAIDSALIRLRELDAQLAKLEL